MREYIVLSMAYSCVAFINIELLLLFWRIKSPEARIRFRLMVLLFPPALALLYPVARAGLPSTFVGSGQQMLDTQTLIDTVDLYLAPLWYPGVLVVFASAFHLIVQVILPVIRRHRQCSPASETALRTKLLHAYDTTSTAFGFSPRIVLTSDSGTLAEVRGVLFPAIVVSEALVKLLDEEELQNVLAHEFAHVSQAHIVLSWISTALRVVMFYNPLAAITHTLIALDAERACDDAAVMAMRRPLAFAAALIKIHRACSGANTRHFSACGSSFVARRIGSWENHALHSFTVERVKRLSRDRATEAIRFGRLREVMAGGAVAAILLWVT